MATTTTRPPTLPPPPPVLTFDEGSRKETDDSQASSLHDLSFSHPRQDVSVEEYYETDRFVAEIASITADITATDSSLRMIRIAIQLPDELLPDAAELCWAFETALSGLSNDSLHFFVFLLGDTTYAPCCPDIIASQHLNAHLLIHYGHACLSNIHCNESSRKSTSTYPIVLYSFGKQPISIPNCVQDVVKQFPCSIPEAPQRHLLLLYEVQYAHAISELKVSLQEKFSNVHVHMGQVPKHTTALCQEKDVGESSPFNILQYHRVMVGGLELPQGFSNPITTHPDHEDLDITTNFILLYIGEASSRPFLNVVLRFLSDPIHRPAKIWTWSPTNQKICTEIFEESDSFQRILNRRYYLVQKAKQCSTFGIIVAHMTEQIQEFVSSIRGFLESHHLSYYTFVVGKINPTKLANFPEVDCFIFVACPEHTLLHNERELYSVPIITPYELLVAFGSPIDPLHNLEWGAIPYSTNPKDYWSMTKTHGGSSDIGFTKASETDVIDRENRNNDDDDGDAPYFSLVTGGYAQKSSTEAIVSSQQLNDASTYALVTIHDGTIMTRNGISTAVNFFQQREYQGLVPMQPSEPSEDDDVNVDIVPAAVMGQTGIASNYGNR